MAEGVFLSILSTSPYKGYINVVDSAGTAGYHAGSSPDSRTMATLKANGIIEYEHSARQVRVKDFEEFDYIFAMDRSNLRDLQRQQQKWRPSSKAKVKMFGEYSGGKPEDVEDPYYGGTEGFELAYEQCRRFSTNFLKDVLPDVEA